MNTEHKSNTPGEIRDLWQTPKFVFNHYHRRFHFNMDVAASSENKLCDMYFSEEDNAFDCAWWNVNWCNPPYSDIMPWVDKAIEEMDNGC